MGPLPSFNNLLLGNYRMLSSENTVGNAPHGAPSFRIYGLAKILESGPTPCLGKAPYPPHWCLIPNHPVLGLVSLYRGDNIEYLQIWYLEYLQNYKFLVTYSAPICHAGTLGCSGKLEKVKIEFKSSISEILQVKPSSGC